MKPTLILPLLIFPLFVGSQLVQAKTFKNTYMSFDLPDTWGCEQHETEWICTPLDGVKAREAMIILAAKEAGPEDSFSAYQAYLSKPKILRDNKNIPKPSKVVHAKPRMINDQQWIEGLQLGSEVPDSYTLYLATVKQGLAVLVSITAERAKAVSYNQDFANAVQSIRLIASNELLSAIANKKTTAQVQAPVGFPADIESLANQDEEKPGLSREMMWGILAALALLVGYFGVTTFFPKKKKKR